MKDYLSLKKPSTRRVLKNDHKFIKIHRNEATVQIIGFTGKLAPNKAGMGHSVNKVMATVFCDAHIIIQIDYPHTGKPIKDEHFSYSI